MKQNHLATLAGLLFVAATPITAQTTLQLSSIIPGTEKVQLVYNGDFQLAGPAATNTHLSPVGWTRVADMSVGPGTNAAKVNDGSVAQANVSAAAPVCQYERVVRLSPNTEYVLSAYMWNLGDEDNNVIAVIDMNDVPEEPQIVLTSAEEGADQGYFVYNNFNTTSTGTKVTLRIFSESPSGKGAAPKYYPVGAQWDNLAITKASDFAPPQPSGMEANVRPIVSITSPADEEKIASTNLQIMATAADHDGAIAKVEFYAGTNKLGEAVAAPYSLVWSNLVSGSYQLTAVATDKKGAGTVSAPVAISVAVPATVPAAEKTKK